MANSKDEAAFTTAAEEPAPPSTNRHPRVREVSSRFMLPLIKSASTPISKLNPSDFSRPKSVLRPQSPRTDENCIPERYRMYNSPSIVPKKQYDHLAKKGEIEARVLFRPNTPLSTRRERIVCSKFRVPSSVLRPNSLSKSSDGLPPITAAASRDDLYLQSSTSSLSSSCPNSPFFISNSTKLWNVADSCSSKSEVRNFSNSGKGRSDCARSLNFSSSLNIGEGISLPPPPVRLESDAKKGRKGPNNQDDIHSSLKILGNRYMQLRFVNAKAEASIHAQREKAQRQLLSVACMISALRDSVEIKRKELAALRRMQTWTSIVEDQMPYLDEWTTLDEDYSNNLSFLTSATLSSLSRLPVSWGVRVDVAEIKEALDSALRVVESVASQIQGFTTKAEETDTLVSELAKVVGKERDLIVECEVLLHKTHTLQINESSLRSSVMQSHKKQSTSKT